MARLQPAMPNEPMKPRNRRTTPRSVVTQAMSRRTARAHRAHRPPTRHRDEPCPPPKPRDPAEKVECTRVGDRIEGVERRREASQRVRARSATMNSDQGAPRNRPTRCQSSQEIAGCKPNQGAKPITNAANASRTKTTNVAEASTPPPNDHRW